MTHSHNSGRLLCTGCGVCICMAHNEWRNDFLPQRITHTPAKRSHSSLAFSQMQVFVIRCDDWLSDPWMYWWGNWFFEEWLTAREADERSCDATVTTYGDATEQTATESHCSDIKRENQSIPERKCDCLDGIHRSEVIHTRNRYTTHTIVVVSATAGAGLNDLCLCFVLLIFILEYFLFFAIFTCANTNHFNNLTKLRSHTVTVK